MDKIAVISDIHGNLEALQTVLKDINNRGIKKIICLGDIIAKGTHQKECIELVKNNCEIVLKGNCDDYFASDIEMSIKSQQEIDRIIWNKSKLSQENVTYLKTLPYSYEFYLSGRLVRLFHAHPEKIDKFIGNIDQIERIYELFLPSKNTVSDLKADIIVYGHIHVPYIQKIYNRVIINPGSIGNAIDVFRNNDKDGNIKNTTVANYLILSGIYNSKDMNDKISYELVSISYDIEKELNSNVDNIEFDSYKEEMQNGKYRDMEKIYNSYEIMGIDKNKV